MMPRAARLGRRIGRGLRKAAGAVDSLVYPSSCTACLRRPIDRNHLCTPCQVELLRLVSLPFCPRCGQTVGPNVPGCGDEGCGACPGTFPRFARVHRLGPYTGPIRRAVRELKYRRRDTLVGYLCGLLGRLIERDGEDVRLVLPVPMYWSRRLLRGQDHSRRLAGALASHLGLVLGDDLVRKRDTPPQVHLPRSRRLQNVRGAFDVRNPAAVDGESVLLVDDVTTTGATADEAARTLLRAGASRVELAVLGKSEPPTAYGAYLTSQG